MATMDEDRFPPIPDALIEALDSAFPAASPRLGETHDTLMFRGGQRSIVEFLRRKHLEQNDALLTASVL